MWDFIGRIGTSGLPSWGCRRRAPPDRVWPPLAALLNYKARVPSPLQLLRFWYAQHPIHFIAMQSYCRVPPQLAAAPQPLTWCANHLFSDTSNTILARPRSYLNPYRYDSLLCPFAPPSITPSLSAGLALTMTSMMCLVVPVAGCLLVRWL